MAMKTRWIPVSEKMPARLQRVYVVCKDNVSDVRYQTIAEYVPYMSVKEEDYMHPEYYREGDYNEEEDVFYTKQGFYEWQSESDIYYRISAHVTHWMPLHELPQQNTKK